MSTELIDKLKLIRESTDEVELFKLCQSHEPAIALEIARSLNSPVRVLDLLTRHTSIVVRHAVALNPNTGLETLKRLSNDKDQLVRDYASRGLKKRQLDNPPV
ncbi:MAG: hypothetical protein ACOYL6_01545 [Bacteriovoracaceae bacterium]